MALVLIVELVSLFHLLFFYLVVLNYFCASLELWLGCGVFFFLIKVSPVHVFY